jgi:hypothetical protein
MSEPTTVPTSSRLTGTLLGALVVLVGVGLLIYVFTSANQLFHESAPPLTLPTPAPKATPDSQAGTAALAIGQSLADYVKRLLALLMMCVAGSLIASVGVKALLLPRK